MQGKKQLLAKALSATKILSIYKPLVKNRLVVYNYHRIRENEASVTDFDDDVFGPTASEFQKQIRWLKNNTIILSEDELIVITEKNQIPKQICTLITFDDGYIDNYNLAYPILKKEKVPAIFFIPTEAINERKLGWWDLISFIIKKSSQEIIEYDDLQFNLTIDKESAKQYFLNKMKLEPYEKTKNLLSVLSKEFKVQIPDQQTQGSQLMTWDQIREMSQNNIKIGSHTNSHRVLRTLDLKTQEFELDISKSILEREIKSKVNSISYPVGGYQHFSEKTKIAAKRKGYRLGFSFNTGYNKIGYLDPYDVKRISPSNIISMLSATTILPEIFS